MVTSKGRAQVRIAPTPTSAVSQLVPSPTGPSTPEYTRAAPRSSNPHPVAPDPLDVRHSEQPHIPLPSPPLIGIPR